MSGKGNQQEVLVTAVSPEEWLKKKADQVVVDVLPSGLAIKRKKTVSVESLALSGHIPLTLMTELTQKGSVSIGEAEILANVEQYLGLINAVFMAAMVSPKIGQTTDLANNTLALAEFDDEMADKLYIMQHALSATEALRSFRPEESGTTGAAAPRRQRVRPKAK